MCSVTGNKDAAIQTQNLPVFRVDLVKIQCAIPKSAILTARFHFWTNTNCEWRVSFKSQFWIATPQRKNATHTTTLHDHRVFYLAASTISYLPSHLLFLVRDSVMYYNIHIHTHNTGILFSTYSCTQLSDGSMSRGSWVRIPNWTNCCLVKRR